MKRLFLYMPILFFSQVVCLNPSRDNIYDPENPDKSYLKGYTYEADSATLEGTIVSLILNGEIIGVDTSDAQGLFEFDEIDPGVYKITAEAQYYSPLEFDSESIWAGTYINDYNIIFRTFDFEDDQNGTATPYGFDTMSGTWQIDEDFQQPEEHSTPNIYNGNDNETVGFALTLYRTQVKNFLFELKLKVLSSSGTHWKTGIVFRYQDEQNYYLLQISSDTVAFSKVQDGIEELLVINNVNFSTETWFSLSIECEDNYMKCYLDGQYMVSAIDNSFSDGYIGLWVLNRETGIITSVNFDDVTIWLK